MRIALHNPFDEKWFAESELARRMILAAQRLGWSAAECSTADQINAYHPDCVLALHDNAPKITRFPTYGCMWSPPQFFEGVEKAIAHILTYDGYLVAAPSIEQWLQRLLSHTPKPFLRTPFYTSTAATDYQAPNLSPPELFYCGSNWDGQRFADLFRLLDQRPDFAVYGNPKGWQYLQKSYRGSLPFDGTSVLNTLHQAGVGLCLHRQEHRQAGVASMRIFEVVAAGAIALCSDHAFIRQVFGDTVLYIDATATAAEQAQQIDRHMAWIGANPEQAIALSQKAHAIFSEHYTLEVLLKNIQTLHQEVLPAKHFIAPGHLQIEAERPVQMILLGQHQPPEAIARSLQSLSRQTYPNLAVTLLQSEAEAEQPEWHHTDVSVTRLAVPNTLPASTALWKGLASAQGHYVGLLNAGDTLHPNHLSLLVNILEHDPSVGVAYSGTTAPAPIPTGHLHSFHPFTLERLLSLQPLVPTGSFLLRQSLLADIIDHDPHLEEAVTLYVILHLAQRVRFQFSYDVTAEVEAIAPLSEDTQRTLGLIFWHQEFAPGLTLQKVQHQTRELYDAKTRIAAMESSKFWQLRRQWFQLKRQLGLPTNE